MAPTRQVLVNGGLNRRVFCFTSPQTKKSVVNRKTLFRARRPSTHWHFQAFSASGHQSTIALMTGVRNREVKLGITPLTNDTDEGVSAKLQ